LSDFKRLRRHLRFSVTTELDVIRKAASLMAPGRFASRGDEAAKRRNETLISPRETKRFAGPP